MTNASLPPTDTTLDQHRCIVWLARADTDRDWPNTTDLSRLLDDGEQTRRSRLLRRADRDRFTIGAVLLRRAIGEHVGIDVLTTPIEIRRVCPDCDQPHGRPTVDLPDVEVSVSHTGRYVAVAITRAGPVGVDVETVPDAYGELLTWACTAREVAGVGDATDFAQMWTRKEAVLKATGTGLRRDPREVVVTNPDEPPALIGLGNGPLPACSLHDLSLDTEHIGAVAVLTAAQIDIAVRDAAPLLAGW
jgi:4'-phosphopantetheinyl transferase